MNQLSQVVATGATEDDSKRLEGVFKYINSFDYNFQFYKVDFDSADIHLYADESIATNKDLTSQV